MARHESVIGKKKKREKINCMMMHSTLYFNRMFKRYNTTLLRKQEWHGRWRSPLRAPVSFLNGAQAVVTTKQRCSRFMWRYINVSAWREQTKKVRVTAALQHCWRTVYTLNCHAFTQRGRRQRVSLAVAEITCVGFILKISWRCNLHVFTAIRSEVICQSHLKENRNNQKLFFNVWLVNQSNI